MATLGSLVLDIGANLAKLQTDMNKAVGIVDGAGKAMQAALRAALAIAVPGGVIGAFKSVVNLGDELAKTAQKAGVTVEALSALKYAGQLADVDLQTLAGGLQKLSRTMSDAAVGSKTASEAFSTIGVNFKNADGTLRATDKVLEDLADRFAAMPDGATKTALAMQLLGRSGAQLIPLLNGGSAALRDAREEAEKLGVVISTQTAKASEEFNDNLTRMTTAMQGLAIQLLPEVISGLANLSTEFVKAYTEGDGLLKVFTSLGSAISRALQGSDQEKLGALLLKEIELERKIAEVRGNSRLSQRQKNQALNRLGQELDSVRKQAEGLRAVMQEFEYGAAPAPEDKKPKLETPTFINTAEQAKQQAELARIEKERFSVYNAAVNETLSQIEEEAREWEELDKKRQAFIDHYKTPLQEQLDTLKEINTLLGSDNVTYGEAAIEAFNKLNPEIEKTTEEMRRLESIGKQVGLTFSSALEDAIVNFESLGDIINGLTKDIARMAVRFFIIEPILKALKGIFDKGGSGGGFSSVLKGLFGGFRAAGGPVQAGRAYVVGENGPEWYVPGASGTIVPNAGGGAGVTIINNTGVPFSGKDRGSVGGRRQIELGVLDALSGAVATGAGARELGLSPAMATR